MNGYVIAALNEDTEQPEKYWNGLVFEDAITSGTFYQDKSAARNAASAAQSRSTDLEVRVLAAQLTVSLGHAATPEPVEV